MNQSGDHKHHVGTHMDQLGKHRNQLGIIGTIYELIGIT